MAKVVILGAGISGHTCASYIRSFLSLAHEVLVISPKDNWNWIPSNIWVAVGLIEESQVIIPLAPLYKKHGIVFKKANAISIHPSGDSDSPSSFVKIEYKDNSNKGEKVEYDYLVNATGPKLNFGATKGLGPLHNSLSVCTQTHATAAFNELSVCIKKMQQGQKQRILIGMGHGSATCQGAAFEYILNVEFLLSTLGIRDKADIAWITNEYDVGDFGMDGMVFVQAGYITPSKLFTQSLFRERGIRWITRAHVKEVAKDRVYYENLDGEDREEGFDFAMLLPAFSGVGLKAYDKDDNNITDKLFNPAGFGFVDGNYNAKVYEEYEAEDWPSTYQNPLYKNIFSIGIAFAPPHPISKPRKSKKGTIISPAPPRTGMPSASMGYAVAKSLESIILSDKPVFHKASMATTGSVCVASAGSNLFNGIAVAMTVFPTVPDYKKYPDFGRDYSATFSEIGLGAHWTKAMFHHLFMYKAKMRLGWKFIPS